jgi:predicted dehydrogenase
MLSSLRVFHGSSATFSRKVRMTPAEEEVYRDVSELALDFAEINDLPPGFLSVTPQRMVSSSIVAALEHWKTGVADRLTDPDDDSGDPREEVRSYDQDNSWRDEIAEFAAAILDGAPIADGSSADALETMRLVYRIYSADPDWRARWGLTDIVSAT